MKKFILTAVLASLLPMTTMAQDDLYFTPSKAQAEAAKKIRQQAKQTYYGGISKTDDEYNRRAKTWRTQEVVDGDSISDIIEFQVGPGDYSDTINVKSYGFDSRSMDDENDYTFSRRMSRFDDWYYGWYDPWMMRHHYWASPYYSWYGPYHYGWYDPWYYGSYYYGGWYDPWYYGGFYDPWVYSGMYYPWGYGYYRPWYGGYYGGWYGGGFITHNARPTGTRNHSKGGVVVNRNHSNNVSSTSYGVANRNGATTTRMTNREAARINRTSDYNSNRYNSSPSYTPSRSNSSNSGGFTGGGYSGGGHSGGGGRSGGGGGGHFGGGRR